MVAARAMGGRMTIRVLIGYWVCTSLTEIQLSVTSLVCIKLQRLRGSNRAGFALASFQIKNWGLCGNYHKPGSQFTLLSDVNLWSARAARVLC